MSRRNFYLINIKCDDEERGSNIQIENNDENFSFFVFRMPREELEVEEKRPKEKRRRRTTEQDEDDDVENGDREGDTTLDNGHSSFNGYATKKTLANSSFELALLVTNAVQLKTLLGNNRERDTNWYVGLSLVCASILIQVINACILVLLGTDDIGKKKRQHRLVSLNNFSLILSVFLAVINVILNIIVAVDPDILSSSGNSTNT